jgi:hypothetical protein
MGYRSAPGTGQRPKMMCFFGREIPTRAWDSDLNWIYAFSFWFLVIPSLLWFGLY